MANYTFSSAADEDLYQIFKYTLGIYGRQKADEYYASIIQSVRTAARFPEIGREYETASGKVFRRYNVARHALFFLIEEDGIFIVRVLHQSRDFNQYL